MCRSKNKLHKEKQSQVLGVEMLRQVLNATQTDVLSVPGAVHSVDVVALLLFQREVQLVGRHVDEGFFSLHCRLDLHEYGPCLSEGQLEVVGLAALAALIAPEDVGGPRGVAAVSPVAQEGVDQLLPPLAHCRQVHLLVQKHHLEKDVAVINSDPLFPIPITNI